MSTLHDRWSSLAVRERWLVGLAVTLGAALVVQLAAQLGAGAVDGLRQDVAAQRTALAMAHELGGAPQVAVGDASPLSARVERSARDSGLAEALRRVDEVDPGRVRAHLVGARFTDLARWLGAMQAGAVGIDTLLVERSAAPGRVDATVIWVAGGP